MREIDLATGVIDRLTECFDDYRNQQSVEHYVRQMIAQRVFGICLGYEDLNDHEQLRYDPMIATLCNRIDVARRDRQKAQDV